MKKNYKEKGFALPLTLLLLVVMALMTSILISITTSEHTANTTKDLSQQSFYAAESGLTAAKNWMISETGKDQLKNSSPSNIDRDLRFCKTSMFPNIVSGSKGFKIERKSLNQVIDNLSADELERLQKFSYEYFITYTPAVNGSTDTGKTKTVSNSEGTDISEGTSYKKSDTETAIYYTIYSCGCNNSANNCNINKDSITRLEQDVTLVR